MSGFNFVLLGGAGVLHRDKLHRDPQSEAGVLCRGEHGGTFLTVSFSPFPHTDMRHDCGLYCAVCLFPAVEFSGAERTMSQ